MAASTPYIVHYSVKISYLYKWTVKDINVLHRALDTRLTGIWPLTNFRSVLLSALDTWPLGSQPLAVYVKKFSDLSGTPW